MGDTLCLRQYIPITAYKPRVYLNGFPKAGLHLLEQMVKPLLSPSETGTGGSQWLGTFKWHSWSNEWQPMRRYLWRMSCLERGRYLMGHSGYLKDIEQLLLYANIAHIFLYRDLRDVAVSQAHHIWDEDKPHWQHEHKDVYRMLGSFDAVLSAVISGMGPYPGVVARWELYAPWLRSDTEYLLALSYEELRREPRKSAGRILARLLDNATNLLEGDVFKFDLDAETCNALVDMMVESGGKTGESTTFREGKTGGWRDAFTTEHRRLWERCDPDGWIEQLGYEW